MSTKDQSPTTKIRFNYINSSKSSDKIPRKLSLKKEDVKNPVFKLLKKKNDLRSKIIKQDEHRVNN